MKFSVEIEKRQMKVTMNGKTVTHKLAWIKTLSVSDFLHYIEDQNNKL